MNKEEIIDKIAKMENEIFNLKKELNKQQEEPKRRWKLELHGKNYCIGSTGMVSVVYWEDWEVDKRRYALGNVFKTQEEAEFAAEQLKVLAELKEYADDDKKWNNSNKHWFIEYSTNRGHIEVDYHCDIKHILFDIYFSSEEQAQRAIDAIGEERLIKYYFRVEE